MLLAVASPNSFSFLLFRSGRFTGARDYNQITTHGCRQVYVHDHAGGRHYPNPPRMGHLERGHAVDPERNVGLVHSSFVYLHKHGRFLGVTFESYAVRSDTVCHMTVWFLKCETSVGIALEQQRKKARVGYALDASRESYAALLINPHSVQNARKRRTESAHLCNRLP